MTKLKDLTDRTEALHNRIRADTIVMDSYRGFVRDLTPARRAEIRAEHDAENLAIIRERAALHRDAISIFEELLADAIGRERFEVAARLKTEIEEECVRLAEAVRQLELIDGATVALSV